KNLGAWRDVHAELKKANFFEGKPQAQEGLFQSLTEEYDLEAFAILQHFLSAKEASHRQRAIELLGGVYFKRKPYAGGWWGTPPAAQKPPARAVAWGGTPQGRAAILRTPA